LPMTISGGFLHYSLSLDHIGLAAKLRELSDAVLIWRRSEQETMGAPAPDSSALLGEWGFPSARSSPRCSRASVSRRLRVTTRWGTTSIRWRGWHPSTPSRSSPVTESFPRAPGAVPSIRSSRAKTEQRNGEGVRPGARRSGLADRIATHLDGRQATGRAQLHAALSAQEPQTYRNFVDHGALGHAVENSPHPTEVAPHD